MQEVNIFLDNCLRLIKEFYEEADEKITDDELSLKLYSCDIYTRKAVILSEKDTLVFYISCLNSSSEYMFEVLDNVSSRKYLSTNK